MVSLKWTQFRANFDSCLERVNAIHNEGKRFKLCKTPRQKSMHFLNTNNFIRTRFKFVYKNELVNQVNPSWRRKKKQHEHLKNARIFSVVVVVRCMVLEGVWPKETLSAIHSKWQFSCGCACKYFCNHFMHFVRSNCEQHIFSYIRNKFAAHFQCAQKQKSLLGQTESLDSQKRI